MSEGSPSTSKPEESSSRRRILTRIGSAIFLVAAVVSIAAGVNSFLSPGSSSSSTATSGHGNTPSAHSSAQESPATPTPSQPSAPPTQYSPVRLSTLCNTDTNNQMEECQDAYTTQQVGSHLYTWDAVAPATTTKTTIFSFPHTTCRNLKLTFGFTNAFNDLGPSDHLDISVWIVQGNTSVGPVTVTDNQVGILAAKLNGGPWGIGTLANLPQAGQWGLWMNGTARCSTYNGE